MNRFKFPEKIQWDIKKTLYALFVASLVLIHILMYGRYDARLVEKKKLEKKVDELRARYLTQLSELMNMNLESQVEKELKARNIDMVKDGLPKKIYVEPIKKEK